MNITQESTGALTATVCIEVEKADYASRVEEKLRDYRKKVKMPGFREGKVPMGVVHKMYGKAILADEINNMISDALQNHLEENDIRTIASPLPNRDKQRPIDFDHDEQFSFYFDIALRPEVSLNLEKTEGIKRYEIEPAAHEVEDYINHIRKSYGSFEDAELAGPEDLVYCEIDEVNDSGEQFNGGIHAHGHLMIEKIVNEEIRNQFVGAGKEKVIRMNPMDAFGNEAEVAALLNMQANDLPHPLNQFDFRITNIRKHVPAQVDEKLLSEVFPSDNLTSEEELRERVRKDVSATYAKQAETKMYNDTLDALLRDTAITLPDDFLKRWLMESGEEGRVTSLEDIENHYEDYANQLRIALLRSQIIDDNQIDVKEDDYYTFIYKALGMDTPEDEAIDEQRKMTVQSIMQNIRKDRKQAEQIADRIIEEKISSLISETVPYTRETISSEEFKSLIKG
ncbi:MAG: trigger factor [Bacteroidales bacterium]